MWRCVHSKRHSCAPAWRPCKPQQIAPQSARRRCCRRWLLRRAWTRARVRHVVCKPGLVQRCPPLCIVTAVTATAQVASGTAPLP